MIFFLPKDVQLIFKQLPKKKKKKKKRENPLYVLTGGAKNKIMGPSAPP